MFKEVNVRDSLRNPITDFGTDWMELAAGNSENGYNAMTVAWGHVGSLWEPADHSYSLPTVLCYVRPSRYTKVFMDKEKYFTLSHFDKKYKKALAYLGSHSGRDGDKISAAGLTPVFEDGVTYFKEADFVYICRKIYQAPLIADGFVDKSLIEYNYPERDFHEIYIGEIIKALAPDN